jgi:hypothetical protein
MGWFQDALLWPSLLTSSDGRDKLKNDIKYGEGVASVGSPLHGATVFTKVHELLSPTVHINDRLQNIKKDGFGTDHLKWAVQDQNHNLQDAFKENIPALLGWMGGAAAGVGGGGASGAGSAASGAGGGILSAGDAAALEAASASAGMSGTSGVSAASGMGMSAPAAGFNWGSAAQQGLGLLGSAGGGQQPQQTAVAPPPQQQPNQSLQQQMARTRRLQQLRMKPRKTLAEQQELQELMRNSQGQM